MGYCGDAGWVYAAREDGTPLVKIGYTRHPNPETRIEQLCWQFHVSFTLVGAVWVAEGDCLLEKVLHRNLAAQRIEGEFFYLPMNQAIFQVLVAEALPHIQQKLCAASIAREIAAEGRAYARRQEAS